MADRKLYLADRPKILYSPNRTNRSNRQASTRVPECREIFLSVANEMQMADRKLYLADRPKILYSPNRTNRSNRQASTRVQEYREIFLSVANEMQMAELGGSSKKFSIRQIEQVDQIDKLPPGSKNIVKYF